MQFLRFTFTLTSAPSSQLGKLLGSCSRANVQPSERLCSAELIAGNVLRILACAVRRTLEKAKPCKHAVFRRPPNCRYDEDVDKTPHLTTSQLSCLCKPRRWI